MEQDASIEDASHGSAGQRTRLGVILVLLSSTLFGLAGIFTKVIAADAWTILTWRGLFGSALICVYLYWRSRGTRRSLRGPFGWRGWLLATVGSLSSVTFIAAFKLTYVANVTVIYALVPFVAAILEWLALRERVRWQTMLAALCSTMGVGVLMSGTLGGGRVLGDLLAVAMMLLNALYVVLVRAFKDVNVVLAGALAALQLFFLGWFVTEPLAVSAADFTYIALFGLSFGAASILWTEGARLIAAAEVGVLSTGDIPIAILFAWLFLSEVPPLPSLFGGGIVMLTVVAYSHWKASSTRS